MDDPPSSLFVSLPDVSAYASQFGADVSADPPDIPKSVFQTYRDRNHSRLLAQSQAPINGQLPYTAPQLLTNEQLRWQLGVTLLGGFTSLLLYSYLFKRPLFG